MSSKQTKKADGASSNKIKDSRFASFETDPRYALPSKKKSKTTIDKRFSRMLKDDDFTATSKVDRYGRKIKSDSKKKALQRLYEEEEDDDEDLEVEDDEVVQRELEKAEKNYDPARGGGFSSGSDSDSDDDDESEEEVVVDTAPDMQKYHTQQAEVQTGEITNRIAIVNLDWDNIKSTDLMALFKSFVPISGRIEKVSVYPSEFGKERMQREELEGPPREIFKKKEKKDDEDSGDDSEDSEEENDDAEDSDEEAKNDLLKEGNNEDFNSDALRTYQLDRLRYYYAVMICSDKGTAQKIYEATDGSEYLSSSNFLDLRFVPDDVTFDDDPRDECDSVPDNYKPVEFVTDALQHSKVKLTWDIDPEESKRKDAQQNAFSGSRTEIAENDLRAYLASDDSDDDEEEEEAPAEKTVGAPKLSKKELARKKLRDALGLKDEPEGKPTKGGPVGDMEITFAPALGGDESGAKKDPDGETTAEKYIRKERERKAKRRELAVANREGANAGAEAEVQKDLGFDDPFFTAEEPKKLSNAQLHKEERKKKREAREAEENQNATEKAQLELLMADNPDDEAAHLDHFDMNEIVKAEKKKNKKKSKKDKEEAAGLQEDFQLDVDDDRFKAVFEDHEFAIDPSNPKFKATSGMKKLLEEGRKKRKNGDHDGGEVRREKKAKKVKASSGDDLNSLVNAIKKKSGAKK